MAIETLRFSKVSLQRGLPEFVKRTPVFKEVEVDNLQTVFPFAVGSASQTVNPRHSTFDDAGEFSPEFRRAAFNEPLACFFRRKPGGPSIRFLRLF